MFSRKKCRPPFLGGSKFDQGLSIAVDNGGAGIGHCLGAENRHTRRGPQRRRRRLTYRLLATSPPG